MSEHSPATTVEGIVIHVRLSDTAREKLRPALEREEKLYTRWTRTGEYSLMRKPRESIKDISESEYALHHLADAVELFDLDGSRRKTVEWWNALISSDRLDMLGVAVTAFVSRDDDTLRTHQPARGWKTPDIRTMILAGYRDIVASVLRRDEGALRAAVLDFQLRLDPART